MHVFEYMLAREWRSCVWMLSRTRASEALICERPPQVHDRQLYELKARMHKLYRIKRAGHPSMIV
jgi:hypothetical protein